MGMFTPQNSSATDSITRFLQRLITVSGVGAVGLLPVLFIPIVGTPLFDGKIYLTTLLISITLILSTFLVLRVGSLTIPASATLLSIWGVVLVSALSAALSGDLADSLGLLSGTLYTTVTVMVGALVLTVMTVIGQNYKVSSWILRSLYVATGLILVWHTFRLLTGADLSFGLVPSQTSSIAGGWIDVAVLGAGFILATLLLVSHSTQRITVRWLLLAVVMAALFVQLVINNFVLWLLLGVVSLTIVVLAISRLQVETTPSLLKQNGGGGWLLSIAGVVFVAALVVLSGGNLFQGALNSATNSTFVEVRPSVSASFDIIRGVWAEDALIGVGPAKFQDAWRVHKSETINNTIFWDTNFASGHSFILTQAAEMGLLGLVVWLSFFGLFVLSGIRTFLLTPVQYKDTSYQMALTAYVTALFLWMCFGVMNPGVSIFMVAAALTGTYIGLSFTIRPRQLKTISILQNQRLGFVLVASLVVIMIALVWFLQQITQQLVAHTMYNRALQTSASIEEAVAGLSQAFAIRNDDAIARTNASIRLQEMRSLLLIEEPTTQDQQAFQVATRDAAQSSQVAAQIDISNPQNWYTRAEVFATLAQAQVEGAVEVAADAVERVAALDPKSPRPDFLRAELAVITGDMATAREHVVRAIQRKPNYTPALFLLAQLEIAEGNVPEAITVTESILSFEPNNPARWYQLGVLYQAAEENVQAIAALSEAIALDSDYANALYIRGVLLALEGQQVEAEADLQRVLDLNPGNELIEGQLQAVQSGTISRAANEAALEALDEVGEAVDTDALLEAAAETDLVTTTTMVSNDSAEDDSVEEMVTEEAVTGTEDEASAEDTIEEVPAG
jgi:tetratricopeptide (TPR) repeat protein/O-antigen ligase